MSVPNSDVSQPPKQRVGQFSLRQCLVAIAMLGVVCAAYRNDPLLGWTTSLLLIVPAGLMTRVSRRGLWLPGLIGALLGAVAAIATVIAAWPPDGRLMIFGLLFSTTMGAIIVVAMNLFKQHRVDEGLSVLLLLYSEIMIGAYYCLAVQK